MRFARLLSSSSLAVTFASISCALALGAAAGCSSSETTTAADTGDVDTGVFTVRPDDGPAETTADAADGAVASDAADDGAPDDGAPRTVDVQVGAGGFSFSPSTVNVRVGDTVKWTWVADGHNVVSGAGGTADGKFCSPDDTGCATAPTSLSGAVYSHTFTAAGTYGYFCKPHATFGMTGQVVVAP